MSETTAYTMFVNSTDSFSDTWPPFFTLLKAYWPPPYPLIVLNTETRDFCLEGLAIRTTRVGVGSPKHLAWGESVRRALSTIETDLIVYLQDDYFLNGPVRTDVLERAVEAMNREPIECVRLMECGGSGPWSPTDDPLFWEVDRNAAYRLTLQAAVWKKVALLKYLRSHETPWQFEVWGSKRASRLGGTIYCLNRDAFNDEIGQMIPYTPTGIVKGRWNRDVVVDLFERHRITVDYSKRGFWSPDEDLDARRAPLLTRALGRLRSL
ncbi:MAG: hypothetical protein M5U22_09565 [Thermoleophilia bacterium]|nr:hypothetical protein [Thermoleophilia bacterium]